MINLKSTKNINVKKSVIVAQASKKSLSAFGLNSKELDFLLDSKENSLKFLNKIDQFIYCITKPEKKNKTADLESFRNLGHKSFTQVNSDKIKEIEIALDSFTKEEAYAFCEGFVLSSYRFNKYFSEKEGKEIETKTAKISSKLTSAELGKLKNLCDAVAFSRDLVNEPVNFLTAEQLSKEAVKLKDLGVKVEVFNKKKIESLKMGGLLAVNKGATNPPTFNILEWKPKNAKNKKPIILVGKGVVYDTGGANIKVADFMNGMKADMGGAASVIGAIYAVAANKLPYHVISLVPATENRINGHEYVSGDVIKMYNGKTVEVLNTDAEGRMILADALAYASKFDPELVLDFATLTGAAYRAIGTHGIVYMGTADDKTKKSLEKSGNNTYERLVEFPFWDEYGEQIKSTIADMTNLGGPTGGAITAGKFLENFTDYPWLHLDIAGPAFLNKAETYRTTGGTGCGVRLVHDFIANL